ncbi:TPA: ZIP zinc transporter [Candidatus Saccharibacteria bacterium]|nr:ZIP zinc transporter [Candidatus Saccharibacteria bacterium]
MNEWLLLIAASLIGSLFSLVGGILLLSKRISVRKVQLLAVPFAAGALLAAAFLDLLPEALEHGGEPQGVAALLLTGFIIFFVLERFLGWFHHHHQHGESEQVGRQRATVPLIVIGDTFHNALDGMVIGAAFLADPLVGIVTTIAIAAHEIPQEIGDFGELLARGMSRKKVLLVNVLSAIVTVLAAVTVFGLGSSLDGLEPVLLSIAAGMFVYIAASDLVPTIHEEPSVRVANYQTIILLLGVLFVGLTTTFAHNFMHAQEAAHSQHEHEH